MHAAVARLVRPTELDADWDGTAWRDTPPLPIANFMGDRPAHFPRAQVKIGYDDTAVRVIFRVEDRYVRAVAAQHQDGVCTDSCVEFFFAPGPDVSPGYFNVEMNCGGTCLFHFQTLPRVNAMPVPDDLISRIETAHSMPRIVDPEVVDPVTWTVEYRLPIDILAGYRPVARPAPGVTWRANFYKCADHTSHPHWLTWSKVDVPRPDVHLPQFFGTLAFE